MRVLSRVIAWAVVASVVVIIAVAVTNEPRPAPQARLAYEPLNAPYIRSECRNHQYFAVEVDARGNETEIDEGMFCDIED
jgi:hypothetical protein